jgi:hypothetical protein
MLIANEEDERDRISIATSIQRSCRVLLRPTSIRTAVWGTDIHRDQRCHIVEKASKGQVVAFMDLILTSNNTEQSTTECMNAVHSYTDRSNENMTPMAIKGPSGQVGSINKA